MAATQAARDGRAVVGAHPRIVKDPAAFRVAPNLADYEAARRGFDWREARALLDGLPGAQGLNIAHEAVDRHATGPRADRPALRWIGRGGALRGGGLVAPAIRHADRLPLDALMAALRDLVGRARGGGLRGSELTDATITVTSLGDRGAESVLPIIYPPQVAMIGFGRIVDRPWVVDGAVGPRRVVALPLAGDHRATDGHIGGLLLARIEALLQKPEAL